MTNVGRPLIGVSVSQASTGAVPRVWRPPIGVSVSPAFAAACSPLSTIVAASSSTASGAEANIVEDDNAGLRSSLQLPLEALFQGPILVLVADVHLRAAATDEVHQRAFARLRFVRR